MNAKKIKDLDVLSKELIGLKRKGKKIVQCHGVFDLLHVGHIYHLRKAKEQGDVLVVSITNDKYVNKGPGRPVFNENLRAETLEALELVDYVCFSNDDSAVECIKAIKPDVYVKGPDYSNETKDVTGKISEEVNVVKSLGGSVFFTDDDLVFSSTNLINRFFGGLTEEQQAYLKQIKNNYISSDKIISKLDELNNTSVLLVGDTIIDKYVYCEPIGQSLKNPLVVNKFISEEAFCGGIIAVANQVAEFCKEVHLVTLLGTENSYKDLILSKIKPNVHVKFFEWPGTPTVVKKRYLYKHADQKVFEICYINDKEKIKAELEKNISVQISKLAKETDLAMIADYGHGLLTEKIIDCLSKEAPFLAVNAQTNSANLGYNFITKKYSNLNFSSLDEAEARLAIHDRYTPIAGISKILSEELKAERLIITRGKNGSVGFENNRLHITPSFTLNVVDRTGAGDAVFSVTAPCSYKNVPLDLTAFIGNAVGSLAVQIVGNREVVSRSSLYKFIETLLK